MLVSQFCIHASCCWVYIEYPLHGMHDSIEVHILGNSRKRIETISQVSEFLLRSDMDFVLDNVGQGIIKTKTKWISLRNIALAPKKKYKIRFLMTKICGRHLFASDLTVITKYKNKLSIMLRLGSFNTLSLTVSDCFFCILYIFSYEKHKMVSHYIRCFPWKKMLVSKL